MTLYKDIIACSEPTTEKEVLSYFDTDKRIKNMKLKSFTVKLNNFATSMDQYTSYHNPNVDHYDLTAIFE